MFRFAIAAAALLAACSTVTPATQTSAAPTGHDCFAANTVLGYSVIDAHSVSVHAGANKNYILSTTWNASDLNWSEAIAIHSPTGWICTGNGLGVQIVGGRPERTYPITGIARAPDPAPQGS